MILNQEGHANSSTPSRMGILLPPLEYDGENKVGIIPA